MSERLPLFPLGVVLFPGMLLPLHVFEERYRRLLRERQGADPIFGVVLTRHGREVGDRPELHRVGTAAGLVAAGRYPDGRSQIVVRGGRRFAVEGGDWDAGYFTSTISWLDDLAEDAEPVAAGLVATVAAEYERFLGVFESVTGTEIEREELPSEPEPFAYAVSSRLPLDNRTRQRLLECRDAAERLRLLESILRHERRLLRRTGVGGTGVDHPGARLLPN